MSDERQGLFAELTPPPGGAERLAERFDTDAPRRRGLALGGAGAAVAVAFVATVLMLRGPNDTESTAVAPAPDIYDAPEFDRLLGRPARPAELSVTLDERSAAVVEVETTNEKIRIYQLN